MIRKKELIENKVYMDSEEECTYHPTYGQLCSAYLILKSLYPVNSQIEIRVKRYSDLLGVNETLTLYIAKDSDIYSSDYLTSTATTHTILSITPESDDKYIYTF